METFNTVVNNLYDQIMVHMDHKWEPVNIERKKRRVRIAVNNEEK